MKMSLVITFIFYFLAFAGIHSLLATDYIKNKARSMFGKGFRFYRITYTIISFLTFAPVIRIWITYSGSTPIVYSIPEWLYPVLILIRIAAIGLFIYAALQVDIPEFTGIRQILGKNGKTESTLITGGAYGIVRHPLYTGASILLFTKMDMSLLDITAVVLVSIYFINY